MPYNSGDIIVKQFMASRSAPFELTFYFLCDLLLPARWQLYFRQFFDASDSGESYASILAQVTQHSLIAFIFRYDTLISTIYESDTCISDAMEAVALVQDIVLWAHPL